MNSKRKTLICPTRKFPARKDFFKEQSIVIPLTGFDLERSEDGLFKSNASMKNIAQLTETIDSLNNNYNERLTNQYKEFNTTKIYFEGNAASRSACEKSNYGHSFNGNEDLNPCQYLTL